MSKVYEEALADARKLRQLAEANAKAAILNSVTPMIREFIDEQLESDESQDESLDEAGDSCSLPEEENLSEAVAISKLSKMLGVGADNSKVFENSAKRALRESPNSKKILQILEKVEKEKSKLSNKEIDMKDKGKNTMKKENKYYELDLKKLRESLEEELEENSDLDMEESEEDIMSELKLVLDLGDVDSDQIPEELHGMIEDDDEMSGDLDSDEDLGDEDTEGLEDDGEGLEGDEGDDGSDDSDDSFEEKALTEIMDSLGLNEADDDDDVEVSEKELSEAFRKLKRSIKEGKYDSSFGGGGKGSAGVDGAFGGKGSAKAGIDGAFGGGKSTKDLFQHPPELNKLNEQIKDERRRNRALNEKLGKYQKAVQALREQLEDLNLFNAKLLYVNKLMQNTSLNESEKRSVIKALDAATSLNEAKQLFSSLTETFTRNVSSRLNEAKRGGSSSKVTRPVIRENADNSNNQTFSKWQRLAGV